MAASVVRPGTYALGRGGASRPARSACMHPVLESPAMPRHLPCWTPLLRHCLSWLVLTMGLGLVRLSAIDVEHFYCGSGMAIEKAADAAQYIFVGSVTKYGTIEAEGPMVHSMTEVEVKIDKP